MLRFVSWNVNGLRAVVNKDFRGIFNRLDADFFCLQETKLQEGQLELGFDGYESYWNYAEKKGYSGTCIFTKHRPVSVSYGIGVPAHDTEGRVITLEYPGFYLVNVYTPNAQEELKRLNYRMEWEDAFLGYINGLREKKPVIFCGDLNVAHEEIDLKNPKPNRGNAGFTDEERAKLSAVLAAGYIDTFRFFHPEETGRYSWWSYRYNARKNNAGWRIDYFIADRALENKLRGADILSDIYGSDHCPVTLEADLDI